MWRLLFLSLSFLTIPQQNQATEAGKCGNQLKQALRKNPDAVTINKAVCPQSYTILMWLRAQKTASSAQAKAFLENHPHWPRLDAIRQQIEKELYKSRAFDTHTIAWFRQQLPLTLDGLKAFGEALLAHNQHDDQKFRQAFLDLDIKADEMKGILASYRALLPDQVLAQKAHNALNKNQIKTAELISPLLKPSLKAPISARLALIKSQAQPPSDQLEDPNVRFEQARLYRKNRQDDQASDLLKTLTDHDNPESVWAERNLIARRLLEDKKYQAAYATIKDHGLTTGENFATAEWLCGWLCLRFLKDPKQAKEHFDRLAENVITPISLARAYYWLGRACQALGETDQAQSWWTKAKKYKTTYYGQLACKELTGKIPAAKPVALTVASDVRRSLESHDLYKYMRLLYDIGEPATAEAFALTLGEQLQSSKEQALLTEIVREKLGKHQALKLYKKIMKAEHPLIPAAYPRVSIPNHTANPAFAHAIIRQESRFQPDVVSSAGATGLMQLMPATAILTAKRHKLQKRDLTDPHHNVQLGTHHLNDLMDKYGDSLILAAAAYNAGAAAVDEWIEKFGDPRSSSVNTIDWVELIPYAETRNYVQRVMENYHCYKYT
jgi:soluble lytic murein transglycosylase